MRQERDTVAFARVILGGPLLSYHIHTADLVLLLLLIALRAMRPTPYFRVFASGCFVVPALAVQSGSIPTSGLRLPICALLIPEFGTTALAEGLPFEHSSKVLEHKSVTTTELHYAKWVKGRQDRLDMLVSATWREN
jgi:hypothetical protein